MATIIAGAQKTKAYHYFKNIFLDRRLSKLYLANPDGYYLG